MRGWGWVRGRGQAKGQGQGQGKGQGQDRAQGQVQGQGKAPWRPTPEVRAPTPEAGLQVQESQQGRQEGRGTEAGLQVQAAQQGRQQGGGADAGPLGVTLGQQVQAAGEVGPSPTPAQDSPEHALQGRLEACVRACIMLWVLLKAAHPLLQPGISHACTLAQGATLVRRVRCVRLRSDELPEVQMGLGTGMAGVAGAGAYATAAGAGAGAGAVEAGEKVASGVDRGGPIPSQLQLSAGDMRDTAGAAAAGELVLACLCPGATFVGGGSGGGGGLGVAGVVAGEGLAVREVLVGERIAGLEVVD